MAAVKAEMTGRKLGDHGQQHDTARLVYSVPEAGRLLGLSRNAAYEAAKRGDIPTLRIGRLLLVPKAPFHRMIEAVAPGAGPAAGNGQQSET